ncbi:glycosyl transferase family 1 [Salicibibacter kimchii]|uniref:Glycosyl transferase family 1 n=2 Tax=Salicibibacter kimchii TaxID=2099786 RepID=A0A345BUD1_9BACI|nr:glycosyltransferase [Salicibibacter kimchii]AXF54562.1 glycosyl transferase family 1 [Salicibibacter kimchii]
MTQKKKVCMLVHTHSFLDSRIFQKEAKSLQRNGYDVTMIVPRMKGKLFNVNKKPFNTQFLQKRFVHEGIKIVTYHYEQFKPTVDYMQSKVQSKMIFNNPIINLGLAENADVYHAHEITSLFLGIGIKRALAKQGKETKLIFDSHDLIPDPFDQKPKFLEMGKLLDKMLEEIDQMITVSPSIKAWYISKQPTLPIEIVYNSPPLNRSYKPMPPKANALTVGYEGHVSKEKKGSSDKIFNITKECKRNIENFKFKIIGGVLDGQTLPIPNYLKQNITLSGWVEFHDIPKQMTNVDIGWIDFDDLNKSLNRSYALPNKFFSYLNNGIPVIVNKCHDMEQFIRTHHCGIVLNKTKATGKDYAKAIQYLHENRDVLQQMSTNARKAMVELYNWEKMEQRLLSVYDSLLNQSKRFDIG